MPVRNVSGDYSSRGGVLCTCLNHVAYRVEPHHIDEIVYAGYRVVMLSGHKHDDGLGNMSS